MYSDDEEVETALLVTKLYSVKAPPLSLGHKEFGRPEPKIPGSKPKDVVISTTRYDPRTRRIYYGQESGDICFFVLDTPGAGSSRYLGSHKGAVTTICIPGKEDGQLGAAGLILTGSADATIKIWDYQGRVVLEPTVCVQTLYGHGGTVTAIYVHSEYIISSSTDKTVRVWKVVEGRSQLVYPWFDLQTTLSSFNGWVRAMAFDRTQDVGDNGAFFAADDQGDIAKIMPEPITDEREKKVKGSMSFVVREGGGMSSDIGARSAISRNHDRSVLFIRYVAALQVVLTLAYDNCLRVYECTSSGTGAFSQKHCWENENRCHFTGLEVDMEFQEVLVVDKQGWLAIFSLRTGRLMATKQLAHGPIVSIAAVLGRQLYAVTTEKDITVWRVEHDLDYNVLRGGHEKAVIALYTCSGGVGGPTKGDLDYRIFSASHDNSLRLWDPYDMACIRVLEEMASEVTAMTFYEAWNILITGHDNGDIRLWNLDTGSHQTLQLHSNAVAALAMALIHRNEELLVSAGFDGMVGLWDVRSLRNEPPHMVAKFKAHGVEPTAVAPEGMPSLAYEPEIHCLAYDPAKKVVATGGNDRIIKVWSATNYDFLGRHVGHKEAVTCLALDANFLFSGSEDCTIHVWDLVPAATGVKKEIGVGFVSHPLKVLRGHSRCVTGVEVIPDSGHLVSCSLDGCLLFWDYVMGTVLHKYEHHEEFRCLALRFDRPEVLVGTMQANILRFQAGEAIRRPAARGGMMNIPGLRGADLDGESSGDDLPDDDEAEEEADQGKRSTKRGSSTAGASSSSRAGSQRMGSSSSSRRQGPGAAGPGSRASSRSQTRAPVAELKLLSIE